jgi:hypothetical protein
MQTKIFNLTMEREAGAGEWSGQAEDGWLHL